MGDIITILGATSHSDTKWVRVRQGDQRAHIRYADFAGSAPGLAEKLADQGVVIIGKKKVEDLVREVAWLDKFPRRDLVDHGGWNGGHFAMPDGQVISPRDSKVVTPVFDRTEGKCEKAGSLQRWKRTVAEPLTGQTLHMFGLMLVFAPPLLRLSGRMDNFGIEFVGGKGVGKSTLSYVMASAIGGVGAGGARYWTNFNTTSNAFEAEMAIHEDLPMIIEEAALFLGGESLQKRGNAFRALTFVLGSGSTKSRFAGPKQREHKFVYCSTSNEPLAELIGQDTDVARAAADRLITLPLSLDREFGALDFVPEGYASASAFMNERLAAATAAHGTAFPAFVKALVNARAADEAALRKLIQGHVERFQKKAKINPNSGSEVRVAQAFGLIYAAGRLAKAYGVLPGTYKCLDAVLACYALYRGASRPTKTFGERLADLSEAYDTVRLSKADRPKNGVIRRASVFVRSRRGITELLVRASLIEAVFPDWRLIQNTAAVRSALKSDEGRKGTKARLEAKGKPERVYCFALT